MHEAGAGAEQQRSAVSDVCTDVERQLTATNKLPVELDPRSLAPHRAYAIAKTREGHEGHRASIARSAEGYPLPSCCSGR